MTTKRPHKGRISISTPDLGSNFLGESVFGHPRAWGGPKMSKDVRVNVYVFSQKVKIAKVVVYVFFFVDPRGPPPGAWHWS